MSKLAFIFPGQGSQAAGMGRDLYEKFAEARAVLDAVDAALGGEKLSKLCFEGPEEKLKLTANTQPAILAVSAMANAVLAARGVRPDVVAGHSLGEYSAYVAAGAVGAAEAAKAVRARGAFMQEAVPAGEGAMAAVLGLAPEVVKEICDATQAKTGKVCSPANYNEPAQTVIAGHAGAVEAAGNALKEAGAKRVVPLPVSAPFHCALMEPVKARLAPVLKGMAWQRPAVPVVTNVEAAPNEDPARAVELLVAQVSAPVRFVECVQQMQRMGVTRMIEVGPGRVLCGLVRRTAREIECLNVEDAASLEKTLAALKGAA